MAKTTEYKVQQQVANYLNLRGVMFVSDLSGIQMPIGLRVKVSRIQCGRPWPDMFVAEMRGGRGGLFLELKASPEKLYTKAGTLRQDKHTQAQADVLAELRAGGYAAEFAGGFDDARRIIDNYLGGNYDENRD